MLMLWSVCGCECLGLGLLWLIYLDDTPSQCPGNCPKLILYATHECPLSHTYDFLGDSSEPISAEKFRCVISRCWNKNRLPGNSNGTSSVRESPGTKVTVTFSTRRLIAQQPAMLACGFVNSLINTRRCISTLINAVQANKQTPTGPPAVCKVQAHLNQKDAAVVKAAVAAPVVAKVATPVVAARVATPFAYAAPIAKVASPLAYAAPAVAHTTYIH
ncbi:hypothetical protein B566_EDAN012537 [Ephemera danica]|nr:hypothetical protein B566_EDAN012537 [Ephemera danica]